LGERRDAGRAQCRGRDAKLQQFHDKTPSRISRRTQATHRREGKMLIDERAYCAAADAL
jgi:hypothetical protein